VNSIEFANKRKFGKNNKAPKSTNIKMEKPLNANENKQILASKKQPSAN